MSAKPETCNNCDEPAKWGIVEVDDPELGTGQVLGSCGDHFDDIKNALLGQELDHPKQPHKYGGSVKLPQ